MDIAARLVASGTDSIHFGWLAEFSERYDSSAACAAYGVAVVHQAAAPVRASTAASDARPRMRRLVRRCFPDMRTPSGSWSGARGASVPIPVRCRGPTLNGPSARIQVFLYLKLA